MALSTPPAPGEALAGTGQSGQAVSLRVVRALGRNTALVAPGELVAKRVPARDPRALRALLALVERWAAMRPTPHVLPLVDALVLGDPGAASAEVVLITPYCGSGALCYRASRSPKSAARLVAAVAAGAEALLAAGIGPHGAITMAHVLLDERGAPRLAGLGTGRGAGASEAEDVRALGVLLHELVGGVAWSSRSLGGSFPGPPPIQRVLEVVLGKGWADMRLVEFRYELAAARGLVPQCDPALPPQVRQGVERNVALLSEDLNSVKLGGAIGFPAAPVPTKAAALETGGDVPVVVGIGGRSASLASAAPVANGRSNGVARSVQASQAADEKRADPPVTAPKEANASAPAPSGPAGPEHAATVLRVTDAALDPSAGADVDWLVGFALRQPKSQRAVFTQLFKRPIGKKPVVALKSTALLHALMWQLQDFCVLITANDGFMSWIENEWSKEKAEKNMRRENAHCFPACDPSVYAHLLRRKALFHRDYATAFSPDWTALPGIDAALRTRHDAAVTAVLDIVSTATTLLEALAAATDEALALKGALVPRLARELAAATEAASVVLSKAPLGPAAAAAKIRVDSAITQTKRTLRLVNDKREARGLSEAVVFGLVPKSGADAEGDDDLQAEENGKKKIKKKKSSTAKGGKRGNKNAGAANDDVLENTAEKQASREAADELDDEVGDADLSKGEDNVQVEREPGRSRARKDRLYSGSKANGSGAKWEQAEGESAQIALASQRRRTTAERCGMNTAIENRETLYVSGNADVTSAKRSRSREPMAEAGGGVSVGSSGSHDEVNADARRPAETKKGSRSRRVRSLSPDSLREFSDEGQSGSSSDGCASSRRSAGQREKGSKAASKEPVYEKPRTSKITKTKSKRGDGGSSDEEPSPVTSKSSKARRRLTNSNSSSSSSNSSEDEVRSKSRRRSTSREKHANGGASRHVRGKAEEVRPAPKATKKRDCERLTLATVPVAMKPVVSREEETRGSPAALAAAASGRKTPRMDRSFEIEPHEVKFGNQVGSGGFGVVFKGKFRGDTVAIKKIHANALNNPASIAEFQSEVAVLSTLNHPNILKFMGACVKPPNLMIITEFMARGTLFDVLHQSQMKVTWPMRRRMALDTCKGVRYLHNSKLLHRDLKSSNLMLDENFKCAVGDFGLTRISRGAIESQMTGQCGTFQYMAPEILRNKPYSEKADVFSFGILLWELVARKLPFFGMQPMQVGIAVSQRGLRPTMPPKTPEPLVKLIRACWHEEPNKRPTMAQVQEILEVMPDA